MQPSPELLRDIHGLDAISWWPPAPGWWLVVLTCAVLAALVWWFLQQRRLYPLGRWQKDAQRKLRSLRMALGIRDDKQIAGELSELLRRIAMARCGRKHSAGLTGEEWLRWLSKNDQSGFDWSAQGQMLLQIPYAPPGMFSQQQHLRQLIDAALVWVASAEEPCRV